MNVAPCASDSCQAALKGAGFQNQGEKVDGYTLQGLMVKRSLLAGP